jgi:uncharacterized membrane-anchored protein
MALSERRQADRGLLAPAAPEEDRAEPPIYGVARLGRRTKDLVRRLRPSDIAVIDHADLDRMAAEDLLASGVRAVVNVAPSSTGRYPNAGPLILAEAGVRLLDVPGADLFERLRDGEPVALAGSDLRINGAVVASGELLTTERLAAEHERLHERVDEALAAFAENTIAHIRQEGELLAGPLELPATRTNFRDRHALIVVRGAGYRRDLRTLRAYIDDVRPVLVGVDGGADAILEAGLKPDVVLGDMDSASDGALRSGAELVVHAYPDGRAPGRERLERLGLEHLVVPAAGTSQDVAMLLAYEKGAALLVSVGSHFNLMEFLGKNRAGMSSTFLTRLRIGETLVDAKGVSRLYAPGVRGVHLAVFALLSALLLVVVVLSSPALQNFFELLWLKLRVLLGI